MIALEKPPLFQRQDLIETSNSKKGFGDGESAFTVIVPSYNGGMRLETVVDDLSSLLEHTNGFLLLVNDGSTDDTQAVMHSLCMRYPRVASIHLDQNMGQQSALMVGMSYCKTPWIITMDDDGSHPGFVIPLLLKKAAEGFNLVYARNTSVSTTSLRSLASFLHSLHFRLFLHCPAGIRVGSFRILSRNLASKILKEQSRFLYVSAMCFLFSPRTATINYRYESIDPTSSRYNLKKLIMLSWNLFYHYGPLRRFALERSE
jgi:polyisoprenyl-phosphate glycosyltransferase